LKRYENPRK